MPPSLDAAHPPNKRAVFCTRELPALGPRETACSVCTRPCARPQAGLLCCASLGGASPSHGASPSQSRRARTRLSARRLFGADTARLPSIPGSDSAIPAPEKIDAAEKASAGAAGAEVAVPATLGEAVAELRR